ncbi:MAG: hypothetical protein K8U03_11840 [Planctomycetia bacterium]|nr:hypothetical protein [Planctomycetia bacterium]
MSLLRHCGLACVVFGLSVLEFGVSSSAFAQADANNPYKQLESTKGVWPPFYKPDPQDETYTKLMAEGWCKPNGKRAQNYYLSKMVDVNKLPEFAFEGKITGMHKGSMSATDSRSGESMLVMIHEDPSISQVIVHGKGTKEMLTTGKFVRFVGRVDATGACAEKIESIELTTPGVSLITPVEPNKTQNLFGKIVRRDGERMVVLAPTGKVHRLTFELAPEAAVETRVSDYRSAGVGDTIKVKCRIFRSTTPVQAFCFADELDVVATTKVQVAKTK